MLNKLTSSPGHMVRVLGTIAASGGTPLSVSALMAAADVALFSGNTRSLWCEIWSDTKAIRFSDTDTLATTGDYGVIQPSARRTFLISGHTGKIFLLSDTASTITDAKIAIGIIPKDISVD